MCYAHRELVVETFFFGVMKESDDEDEEDTDEGDDDQSDEGEAMEDSDGERVSISILSLLLFNKLKNKIRKFQPSILSFKKVPMKKMEKKKKKKMYSIAKWFCECVCLLIHRRTKMT